LSLLPFGCTYAKVSAPMTNETFSKQSLAAGSDIWVKLIRSPRKDV